MEEDIQYFHPGSWEALRQWWSLPDRDHSLTLDKIILHDKWVKNNPVDEGYEESHRGCAGLKAPGKWVESRESVWEAGARPQSAAQHDPGINEIMEGEQSNTCRGQNS